MTKIFCTKIKKKKKKKDKKKVNILILGMVDYVANCSSSSVVTNSTISSFIEINKLTLVSKKCGKIHIGEKSKNCPTLKVHEEVMKDSSSEKYLGNFVLNKGTLDDTIKDRKLKGYSYISEIRALLSDMPFGHRRIKVGLMLRDAMFVNG